MENEQQENTGAENTEAQAESTADNNGEQSTEQAAAGESQE